MKRIILLVLTLLLMFSTTTLAQQVKTYEVGDYFTVSVPDDCDTLVIGGDNLLIVPLNKKFESFISVHPIDEPDINRMVDNIINTLTGPIASKMIGPNGELLTGFQLIKMETLNIDSHDARSLLFAFNVLNEEKQYKYAVICCSDHYSYFIGASGKYTDRKVIDAIITSIKILK